MFIHCPLFVFFDDFDDFAVVNGENLSKMCSFVVTFLTSLPLQNKPGVI